MSNFQFRETPNTTTKVIETITLTTNEFLSFPSFFLEMYKIREMGNEIRLRMYYDKRNRAIAMQFVDKNDPTLYKVNVSEKYGATSKIRAFLLNNDIDIKKYAGKYEYVKYQAEELGLEGPDVFVVQLGSGGDTM